MFPYSRGADLTLEGMNWTVVVYFGPMLLAYIYYAVHAHKFYVGPKSNLDENTLSYAPQDTVKNDGIPDSHGSSDEKQEFAINSSDKQNNSD